ncbi:SMI1/KNR4 family protein [Dinghuibacter silviterrae]|uniref:SMI1/KNR4 family protein SUKH-1 n=1 Tax=Dinghuibacter silviterrae TaxID=1539049 RepID=A0A4R8DUW0_9BACT|nr:SMI1/KNR4 family protein [Dinghuibacter silviterrae]TDX02192.1 SMI1/KNR4 family protein SUKH-1 [Dinghuibacter silviterrae]
MNAIKTYLDQLLQQLIKSGSPLVEELQSGVENKKIEGVASKYGINFNEEVYELYSWRNGINESHLESNKLGELELFRLAIFPPFEMAVEDYDCYSRQNNYWKKDLFPLFGSGGGDYYLINCSDDPKVRGMIFYYSPTNYESEARISIFDSLQSLVQSVTICYERQAYQYTSGEDKYLDIDYELEAEICRAYNPLSAYWRADRG